MSNRDKSAILFGIGMIWLLIIGYFIANAAWGAAIAENKKAALEIVNPATPLGMIKYFLISLPGYVLIYYSDKFRKKDK